MSSEEENVHIRRLAITYLGVVPAMLALELIGSILILIFFWSEPELRVIFIFLGVFLLGLFLLVVRLAQKTYELERSRKSNSSTHK